MSKNIKEIGKELLGESLNSFHRKTGLTQLEKNNEMQDGILNGILSQVDNAYIEKTEQYNVIHLNGSGDGVVVLDSIEGNTKVNLIKKMSSVFSRTDAVNKGNSYLKMNHCLKPNMKYTRFVKVEKMTLNNNDRLFMCDSINDADGTYRQYSYNISKTGWYIDEITTPSNGTTDTYVINPAMSHFYEGSGTSIEISNIMIVEGSKEDNATVIEFFEGLQSSFEDKVNDEGKYEIEILSNNGNIFDINAPIEPYNGSSCKVENESITVSCDSLGWYRSIMTLDGLKPNTTYYLKYEYESISGSPYKDVNIHNANGYREGSNANALPLTNGTFTTPNGCRSIKIRFYCGSDTTFGTIKYKNIMISENDMNYIPRKHNKIKLLINEPLRGTNVSKDMLCIKDGKLVVERRYKQLVLNGNDTEKWNLWRNESKTYRWSSITDIESSRHVGDMMCDKIPRGEFHEWWNLNLTLGIDYGDPNGRTDISSIYICNPNLDENVTSLRQWLSENNLQVVLPLKEPYYEEVLNEYGEPIILEGYENGTLYIDSTVMPTTTVRYTPKMESFKTLKEVNKNNNLITLDINENIIPYMMDVDYMIMEKELCLLNTKNIRKMEELDMTSMQKRTQDMLERLIKGKTLTEQECKTRVTTYLNAGKITDEQAEELMLVISEVYA